MKDEITRIMRLVKEGKLTPEDAAELVEAFEDAPREEHPNGAQTEASGEPGAEGAETKAGDTPTEDPLARFIGSIEKIGKDVAKNVDWEDIATQVRQGLGKGVEAIKKAAEEARKGGGFSFVFGPSKSKRVELPISVPPGKTLRIENQNGDVTVYGGHDIGSLIADATFRAGDETEAQRLADQYTPVLEEGEDFVLLRQPDTAGLEVDLTFHVARGTIVEVKSSRGDVTVSNTFAACRVNGSSGSVTLEGVEGAIEVGLMSGDVRISDTKASILTADTKSGDVRLDRVTGVINVRTASGDVTGAECAPSTLSVEAASGDVHVDFSEPIRGTVNVRTVAGDIELSIPDGGDCRVSLSTLRGSVASEVALFDEAKTEHKVSGRIGEGGGTLDASAVSGDVRLALRYTLG